MMFDNKDIDYLEFLKLFCKMYKIIKKIIRITYKRNKTNFLDKIQDKTNQILAEMKDFPELQEILKREFNRLIKEYLNKVGYDKLKLVRE